MKIAAGLAIRIAALSRLMVVSSPLLSRQMLEMMLSDDHGDLVPSMPPRHPERT